MKEWLVMVIAYNKYGQIFVYRKNWLWQLPSGICQKGETIEECAFRVFFEQEHSRLTVMSTIRYCPDSSSASWFNVVIGKVDDNAELKGVWMYENPVFHKALVQITNGSFFEDGSYMEPNSINALLAHISINKT